MSFGSALSSLAGGVAGGAKAAAGDVAGFFANRYMQRDAQDFTRDMMKNRHQWEVSDLRKAGLNPILSAGGAPSMGGSPALGVSMGDPYSSAVSAARQKQEAKLMKKQEAEIDARTDEIKSRAELNRAKANMMPSDLVKGGYTGLKNAYKDVFSALGTLSVKGIRDPAQIKTGDENLKPIKLKKHVTVGPAYGPWKD